MPTPSELFSVSIGYDAATRMMSDSHASNDDYCISTTGDNDSTTLNFTITDPDNTLQGYAGRVEFDVWVHGENNTVFKPYILLDANNSVKIPDYILLAVKGCHRGL